MAVPATFLISSAPDFAGIRRTRPQHRARPETENGAAPVADLDPGVFAPRLHAAGMTIAAQIARNPSGLTAASASLAGTAVVVAPQPAMPMAALTQVLYLQQPGDASAISINDIYQGQIGDCFLLAAIGELALWHPSAITNMIHLNADGTETVTLYLAASGQLPSYGTTQFQSTTVTITNTFPANAVNNATGQGEYNGQKEIWVQVLEKAYATLVGGYSAITNGGNPMIAMQILTGQTATWTSPASVTLTMLQDSMAAGDLITMDTAGSGVLPYGLVNSHAYIFRDVALVSGSYTVYVDNPWGYSDPSPIPLAALATAFVEVDIGHYVDSNLISGGPGNDVTTLSGTVSNASIDLGTGNDTLTLADGTNSATVARVETIIGGTGADTISLSTVAASGSVDLGSGSDSLTFGDFSNTATLSQVESITGGTGNDVITLASALTAGMSLDLGAGKNRLTLASGGNTGTVHNVATLGGGGGNDAVTYGDSLVSGSVELGVGNDLLVLANHTNRVSVANTETIQGGTGNDTIILSGTVAATVIGRGGMNFITGGSGSDQFVFQQNGHADITWVRNFDSAGGDRIALDTTGSNSFSANTYDLGGAALSLGVDIATVADVQERLGTALNNGGKGAFLYQQDTGELCYSGDGSFTGGGTVIGVLTTNGVTPWTFSLAGFTQV